MKRALITGVTGQDGSYLAELLVAKGYEVSALVLAETGHQPVPAGVRALEGDLADSESVTAAVRRCQPDEIYNLAAQSNIPVSWERPVETGDITGLGPARLLEAIRRHRKEARFFQASSAAIFGLPAAAPQNEDTPVRPHTPYGAAKAFAHFLTAQYRERYGLFACSGILYNHESPRRTPDFVTRKVTTAAVRIKLGLQKELVLGDLEARRDWGYAADYVQAMWLMLQQARPQDFVIATGRAPSVGDLVRVAFGAVGLDWRKHVTRDEALVREEGAVPLIGDASRARRELGWEPQVSFEAMIEEMVQADMKAEQLVAK